MTTDPKGLNAMGAVKKTLDKILKVISVALFALLVLIVVWQVISRQILQDPAGWTEELARFTFVWLGFFAATLVFAERGHIAVDFVARKSPPAVQKGSGILSELAIIAFAVLVLVWGGWRAVVGTWGQRLGVLPAQLGMVYIVMPIAGVLITFYAVYHLAGILTGHVSPLVSAVDLADESAS